MISGNYILHQNKKQNAKFLKNKNDWKKIVENLAKKIPKNIIMVVVSSLGPPEEGIVHKEANVTAFLNDKNVGKGTLHISEARVTWVGNDAGAHTFSLEYNHIGKYKIFNFKKNFIVFCLVGFNSLFSCSSSVIFIINIDFF